MGFEFLVVSGDSLVQIAAANGETRVVFYALRYFWRAGGECCPTPAVRGPTDRQDNAGCTKSHPLVQGIRVAAD